MYASASNGDNGTNGANEVCVGGDVGGGGIVSRVGDNGAKWTKRCVCGSVTIVVVVGRVGKWCVGGVVVGGRVEWLCWPCDCTGARQ